VYALKRSQCCEWWWRLSSPSEQEWWCAVHSINAFGIDNVIELVSEAILLWRLLVEAYDKDVERIERTEQRAVWVVGFSLARLCVYVLATAVYGIITRSRPESFLAGVAISVGALVTMPILGITTRRIAACIDSRG